MIEKVRGLKVLLISHNDKKNLSSYGMSIISQGNDAVEHLTVNFNYCSTVVLITRLKNGVSITRDLGGSHRGLRSLGFIAISELSSVN